MENKIEKRNVLSTVSMIMFMILMAAATAVTVAEFRRRNY